MNQLELDVQRYKHERDTARKELDGEKELCSKLDIEIEKLNAEVREYSEIRQDVSVECISSFPNRNGIDGFLFEKCSSNVRLKGFAVRCRCQK